MNQIILQMYAQKSDAQAPLMEDQDLIVLYVDLDIA
jgi:hypothetical protein